VKKHLVAAVGSVLLAVVVGLETAHSHDGWIEAKPSLVERGQAVSIDMLFGNHSAEHMSYRIAAKWAPDSKLHIVDPRGDEHDVTGRIADLGEAVAAPPAGVKGFLAAPFRATRSGIHFARARWEGLVAHDGVLQPAVRVAKAMFASLSRPALEHARALEGFDRAVAPDALEIVPVRNPFGLTPHDRIGLEIRLKGEPVAGAEVVLIGRLAGSASAQARVSDGRGRVYFSVDTPDWYLARLEVEDHETTYEATYTFQVFHPDYSGY
jgi:uncharacterized GH25 family protein